MNLNKWQAEVLSDDAQVVAVIAPRCWGKTTLCRAFGGAHVVPTAAMARNIEDSMPVVRFDPGKTTRVAFDEFAMMNPVDIGNGVARGLKVLMVTSLGEADAKGWVLDYLIDNVVPTYVFDVFQMPHVPFDHVLMARETMTPEVFEAEFMPHRTLLKRLLANG